MIVVVSELELANAGIDIDVIHVSDKQAPRQTINYMLCNTGKFKDDIILTNLGSDRMSLIHPRVKEYFSCYYLYSDLLCLQVQKDSPLAEYEKIPLKMLEDLPLLIFDMSPDVESEFTNVIKNAGCELHNANYTSNLETCSIVALNTGRCCFVGYPSCELRPLPNVAYVPLEIDYHSEQLLLIRKTMQNNSFVKYLCEYFDQYFETKKLF